MSVTPIPGEHLRYFVASGSRPLQHVVDLAYQEEPWSKPKGVCGCERGMAHNEFCKHLKAVVDYERERLGI